MARVLSLVLLLRTAQAVPVLGNESQEEEGVRRLQAGGRPDQCSDDASFQAWLALVNSACCEHAATPCTNGLPSACDEECANVLTPVRPRSPLGRGAATRSICLCASLRTRTALLCLRRSSSPSASPSSGTAA